MIFTSSIICFLLLQNFAIAQDDSIRGTYISWPAIVIIIGSVCITIIFAILAYLTLKYMKKKFFQPQYYVDDVPVEKDGYEYNDVASQTPDPQQIQPIITVSEVVSSLRQSLDDLGHAVVPKRWSTMLIRETPIEEKIDLSI